MIIVQDIHQVVGRSELDFEGLYRDTIGPSLAKDDRMSLASFAWCPHGSGEGYEAVTVTALADGEALDSYQERIRFGDLGEVWTRSEAMRYSLHSSAHLLQAGVADWLERISPQATATSLHRLDILDLSAPAQSVVADLDQLINEDDASGLLSPLCWWSPLLGDADARSVTVLSRVTSDAALKEAFSPEHAAGPWGRTAEDLLNRVVSRAHRRLLRSPAWGAERP